ncbi:translesion error-prone DNA polymerase V subunit UmuC [Klebsiella pneumoniae subsp. pneumoniae]|nr:translesion error-prone DNA polymerase V subunit UmuC [Klebsiella pneumoniae subsp. pneumoniae]
MFAHCDVNAFLPACQTAFRPDLKGRPVVVLSNNDGCVIARSAEAKPFVKMGEPYFKQKAAFLRHGVVAFSSNYELYADMSSRVMATLEELTPRCEIYSIDEAFCDVSGVRHCKRSDRFWPRNPRHGAAAYPSDALGVGIAPTKTLAKLANHAAKRWPRQTGGVVELVLPAAAAKADGAAAGERGLGHRAADRQKSLKRWGSARYSSWRESDIRFIRKHFTVVLERTVRELRGEPCLALEEFAPAKQEIICSRSFGDRITAYEDMRQAICSYAARAAEKLRGEHQYCRFVSAFVKTSPLRAE